MIRLSDRFVLEHEIGSGGMSRVFLGRDEILDRPVAVKILKTEYGGTDIGARFQREGRTAAKLSHPNIVQVYDAGEGEFEGEAAPYIVMEYVTGGDLKALIDELGTLSGGRLSAVGAEVAAGLAHAHERGVIHRDIKPHNVLLEEGGRARLTDFGIARALDASQATRTGSYLGTALYSPPEQLRGGEVTPKSDVYSLGATLYQAATGEPPFAGTPIEIASQHVHKEPTPPREVNPSVSGAMEDLILACMSKDPDARPTADEARIALLEAGRGVHATRAYTEAPAEEPATRRPAPPAPAAGGAKESSRRRRPAPAAGGARENSRRRPGTLLAILAVVVTLAAIGALAASTLLSGGEQADDGGQQGAQANAQSNAQSNDEPASDGPDGGGQGSSDGQTASGSASSSDSSQSRSGDAADEAEQTVEDFYSLAARGDYDRSYDLLSAGWKQAYFPSQAELEGTFGEVEDVTFIEGPTADVSGNTATVTGTTRAELTTETQRNEGTWFLVRDNGGWLIEEWEVNQISSTPA